jgi:ABC-2 type transport system permease protein
MVVHGDKLRWLAWLRLKMLTRSFRRSPSTLVFTIIGLLFALFFAGSLGFFLFFAFSNLSAPADSELLYLLFSGALLFWIVLPLLSFSTNEGLDVTKLQLFPLTRLEVMFSLLFSSLFDLWTLFLFVLFGVTIAAWWTKSPALGLAALLVIVVFYLVMVGISQLILALLMRTLQSRRFRDLSIIIIALFSSSCYLVSRFASGASNILNVGETLDRGGFSPYLQWLPSGVAASALRDASQGNWGGSFAMLCTLLIIGALALYLWQMVLERSMTASETGGAWRARRRQAAGTSRRAGRIASVEARSAAPARGASPKANLWDQLQALVKKELLCFWRDPQLKVRVFQIAIYVLIFVLVPAFSASHGGANGGDSFYTRYTPFTSVAVVFLFMLTLSLNTLGIERQSLTTLFLFPIDRRRLLWGKNLTIFLMGLVVMVLLLIVCTLISHEQPMILPAAVIGLAGLGVTLGCGNLSSVYFPRYQRPIGQRGYTATGGQAQSGGCLNSLMSTLMLIVTVLLLSPVALGIGIPFFLNMQWLWAAAVPLSLAYGLVLYIVFTNIAAKRMLASEPEILNATTRE